MSSGGDWFVATNPVGLWAGAAYPHVKLECGSREKPEIDEEQVKELHAKIGDLAVANSFLERKLKRRGGK